MATKIRLIFSNSKLPLSPIIRWVTWSDWSHVAILFDDNLVIESTLGHGGVKTCSLDEFKSRASEWAIFDIECKNPEGVLEAAMSQVGKPYDWTGILGIGFHRDWQEDDAWWCSEFMLWCFDESGDPKIKREAIRRATPQHCYMISGALLEHS